MSTELQTLIDIVKDAEARATAACQNTSTKDLDDLQSELEGLTCALTDAINTIKRAMDVKKAELNDMKNDVNELDARVSAAKSKANQCKRSCISLRIAARELTPFPPKM